jgi:hypothetical protein
VVDAAETWLAAGVAVRELTGEHALAWLGRFQEEIGRRSAAGDLRPGDFACTLLAAIVGVDRAAYLQIGDGAIVTAGPAEPDLYAWIFWPQRGEYENTPYFATGADAAQRLAFETGPPPDEIALFTDGLQWLALDSRAFGVHDPFFRPMFAPLRAAAADDQDRLSAALARFLASPRVCDRTDDDKTLILATRRRLDPPPASPAPHRAAGAARPAPGRKRRQCGDR